MEISVVLHLVRFWDEGLVADLALERLDSGVFSQVDFKVVSCEVGFVASLIRAFVPMLSRMDCKVWLHKFAVLENFGASRKDTFNLFWLWNLMAKHVVLKVLLLFETLLTFVYWTLKSTNLEVELDVLCKSFACFKLFTAILNQTTKIGQCFESLNQMVLFWYDGKYTIRLICLLIFQSFYVLILCDSLIGKFDFYI